VLYRNRRSHPLRELVPQLRQARLHLWHLAVVPRIEIRRVRLSIGVRGVTPVGRPRPLRWSNWGAHRPAPPVCDKPPTGPVGSGRADRIPSTRTHQRDPLLLPSSRSPRPPPVCRSAGSLRSPPAPFSQLTVARSVCSSKLTVDRPAVAQLLSRRARKGEARKPGVHSGSTGVGRWHGRLRSCPGLPPGRRFIRERRLCSYHTRRRGRRMNPTKPPTVNRAHM
jgi:hypothetical protein